MHVPMLYYLPVAVCRQGIFGPRVGEIVGYGNAPKLRGVGGMFPQKIMTFESTYTSQEVNIANLLPSSSHLSCRKGEGLGDNIMCVTG